MTHRQRLEQIRSLSSRAQALLFERASGNGCTLFGDFVPSPLPPLAEVVHHGFNSMPLFRRFQKRVCRLPGHQSPTALGYNEQPMKAVTGPGYFVASEAQAPSGVQTVLIDYRARLPEEKPAGWPSVLQNNQRLSRFIYFGTQDWMWRVSAHVTIGRARRERGWMDNWFVLCRQPS
jgi:hypothetical protein